MTRTGALLLILAAALVLAGCSTAVPPQSPPPVSLAEELANTPAVAPPLPGSEEHFLTLLDTRGVPYTGRTAQQEASIVCATLASGAGWDQAVDLAPFPGLQQRRGWVLTAVEVYCPELG